MNVYAIISTKTTTAVNDVVVVVFFIYYSIPISNDTTHYIFVCESHEAWTFTFRNKNNEKKDI